MTQEYNDAELRLWVENYAKCHCGAQNFSTENMVWEPLQGDAGSRRYTRVNAKGQRWIAVYYPASALDELMRFEKMTALFTEKGIPVPHIFASDTSKGFALLEDFGAEHVLDVVNDENADVLYGEAVFGLLRLQQLCCTDDPEIDSTVPLYTQEKLLSEMALAEEWFYQGLLNIELTPELTAMLNDVKACLLDAAWEQPKAVVHRDYHSRNLLYRDGQALGLIDYQDAVVGPFTYDVVSLFRDCYVAWPPAKVQQWALAYLRLAQSSDLFCDVKDEDFLRWFDWMGLQRHIKVLGIFARLTLRDEKHGYLVDLPRVISYIQQICHAYKASDTRISAFYTWFNEEIVPVAKRQEWWRNYD